MTPAVVLIGLPGAGKTTTGRRLAALLDVEFADSDELIARAVGRPVPEFLAQEGEAAFRAIEAATVVQALAEFRGVLALGGGAVTTPEVRAALTGSGVPVALLRTGLATLGRRVGDARTRPLLAGDPRRRLRALAAEREPLYRQCATLVVDTDDRAADEVAEHLAEHLAAGAAGRPGDAPPRGHDQTRQHQREDTG